MRGLRVLIGPTVAMIATSALAAAILKNAGVAPSWPIAFYQAYQMLMGEFLSFPSHPVAQAVTVLMPLLGILFVAEGVIKLGFSTFRKKGNLGVWIQMLASTSRQHVILCGLGTVGYRVLEELLAVGEQVFVIERSPTPERRTSSAASTWRMRAPSSSPRTTTSRTSRSRWTCAR